MTAFWEVTMLEAARNLPCPACRVTYFFRSAKFPSVNLHMHVMLWQLLET